MRLVMSVRIVIGFAVAGVTLVSLSGNVLAADGSLATTSQAPTIKIQLTGKDSLPEETVTGSGLGTAEMKASAGETDQTVTSPNKPASEVSANPVNAVLPVAVKETLASNTAEKTVASKAAPVAAQTSVSTPVAAADMPLIQNDRSSQVPQISSVDRVEVQPSITQALPATTSSIVELPIQPVITNRTASLAEDLAAAMPSSPDPIKSPAPAKSMGLLGRLKAELAGMVMPQFFAAHSLPLERPMTAIASFALVVLLSHIFAFIYGSWLRRGGFANAARSDVPSNLLTPSIATPFLLGYVPAPARQHGPFSMVAEIKNTFIVRNAIRKEERE